MPWKTPTIQIGGLTDQLPKLAAETLDYCTPLSRRLLTTVDDDVPMTTNVLGSTAQLPRSTAEMDERSRLAWLHRRGGFGVHVTDLDAAVGRGLQAELGVLTEMRAPAPDPFAGFDPGTKDDQRQRAPEAVLRWIDHMATSTAPGQDRLTWLLHGLLVSSGEKVRSLAMMTAQISRLATGTTSTYPQLLEAITTDAAMLWYLDGRDSTAEHPNENFSRELMELFALGVGNYTEADVAAGARALTGWTLRRQTGEVRFVSRRADRSPQSYLGVTVTDVSSVIDAVTSHPAHATFIARRIAREYLGRVDDSVIAELAEVYVSAERRLAPVVARALQLGLDGVGTPLVLAPVPWLAMARRVTGVTQGLNIRKPLATTGQIPLRPPNVSGWPTGRAWLSTSATVGRAHMAAKIAAATEANERTLDAARQGDLEALRLALGLPIPFSATTADGLRRANSPVQRLAMALVSPEFVLS